MKKRAQSNIIVTVLLIVLGLAAIVIVWNVVNVLLKKSSSQVNIDPFSIQLELKEAKIYPTGQVDVKVNRKPGEGNINSLKFIFYDKNNNIYSVNRITNISQLETLQYNFSYSELNNTSPIQKVVVVPIIGNKAGLEFQESDIRKDEKGERAIDNPTGLVSWWKFDGNMQDSISQNHGSCTSCPTSITDRKGNLNSAYNFTTGNYISINAVNLIPDTEWSVSAWVKLMGTPGDYQTLLSFNNGGLPRVDVSHLYDVPLLFLNDPYYRYGSLNIKDNNWHHIFYNFNYSGNIVNIFIDGINKTGNGPNGNKLPITNNWKISYPSVVINGTVDDIIVFSRSLSPDEIRGLYNNQK